MNKEIVRAADAAFRQWNEQELLLEERKRIKEKLQEIYGHRERWELQDLVRGYVHRDEIRIILDESSK